MGNILPQRGPPESGAEQSSSSGLGALGLGQQHPPFNAQYYYPPPRGGIGHGKYFGGTFIMGGDKFEMSQPEAYLFGDNLDLNYLGGRPCPFPYSAPLPNEPMHMLRALVNIRKETLKLVAVPPGPQEAVVVAIQEDGEADNLSGAEVPPPPPAVLPSTAQQQPPQQQYAIEFIFDADVDCTITIYLLCREEILLCSSSTSTTTTGVRYTPKDPRHRSPPYRYKAGIGQHFSQSSPLFNPHQYHAPDLSYHVLDEKGEYNATALYPLVIHVVADGDGSGGGDRGDGIEDICLSTSSSSSKQSHTLIASLEKLYEEVFSLKPLKQKLFVDGLSYLLQEIYGIENKVASSNTASNGVNKNSSENPKNSPTTTGHHFLPSSTSEEDSSENSYECVICMSDLRDTLILPCRHLCLCKSCANSLRYQANNCPICRVPFRALLQIKAVKRQQQQQQQQQPPMMMINSSGAAVNNGVNNSGGGGSSHNVHNSGGNTTTAASLGSNLLSSNHIININSQQHLVVSESLNELTVDIPPGFEIVPLVEALNGVVQQQQQQQSGGSNHQLSYSVPKHLKQQQQHSPTPQLPHVLPPSRDGGMDLSPEEHLSEKSLGSADFEAGAAKSKKSKKKSGSSSLESMSNCCNNNNNSNNNNNNNHSAAKFDIDVDCGEGGGGGGGDCDVQHPLEDIVSFRKKSGADEYDIKYFYSNSSPPKGPKGQQPQKSTNRSNHHHHHHHHQPKMYIPVATSAPTTTSTSTDDSTSASSSVSSSGGASGVEGMGVTVQEKTRLLRKSSSKTGGGSLEQPAAVIVGSGNSSSTGGDHCYRHSQPHSHSHHRQLDQSSQSDDYCAEESAAAAVVVGDEEGEEVVAEVDPDDDNDRDPVVVAAIQQQHSSRAT